MPPDADTDEMAPKGGIMPERINRWVIIWLALSLSLNAGQLYRSTSYAPEAFARPALVGELREQPKRLGPPSLANPAPVSDMNVSELRVESKRLGLPAYQRGGVRMKKADLVEQILNKQIEEVEHTLRALSKRLDEG